MDVSYRGTMRRLQRCNGRYKVLSAWLPDRPRDTWVMPLLVAKAQRVRYRQLTKAMQAI